MALLILASTSLFLQIISAVPLTDKDGKVTMSKTKQLECLERTSLVKKKPTDNCHRQVWECDNAFYQKLAPVEWQRECAGNSNLFNHLDIDNFYHSDVFLNRDSSSHSSATNKKEPGTCSYERRPCSVPKVYCA